MILLSGGGLGQLPPPSASVPRLVVQKSTGLGVVGAASIVTTGDIGTGDGVWVGSVCGDSGNNMTSCTDDSGNSYVMKRSGDSMVAWALCENAIALSAGNHITPTFGGSDNGHAFVALALRIRFSGSFDGESHVDVSGNNPSPSTSLNSPGPTDTTELLLAACGFINVNDTSMAPNGGWTQIALTGGDQTLGVFYQLNPNSIKAFQTTWSGGNHFNNEMTTLLKSF